MIDLRVALTKIDACERPVAGLDANRSKMMPRGT